MSIFLIISANAIGPHDVYRDSVDEMYDDRRKASPAWSG